MQASSVTIFKSIIGQDHEPCDVEEVFSSPELQSSRLNKFLFWSCFSLQRTASSTGGLTPLLTSYKLFALILPLPAGSSENRPKITCFLSSAPSTSPSILAEPKS
ncbi:hypothetical protein ACFX13_026359 [Malus domestica]